jgi:hypothetical protein
MAAVSTGAAHDFFPNGPLSFFSDPKKVDNK